MCADKATTAFDYASRFVSGGKSARDFGSHEIRGERVRTVDAALGKIGEFAFAQVMSQFGIELLSDDFIRYGSNEGDFGQDISEVYIDGERGVLVPKIDVKATKAGSGWLLIERHRLQGSIFVMVRASVPRSKEDMVVGDVMCEVAGFAFYDDLMDSNGEPYFRFRRGGKLLKPDLAESILRESGGVRSKMLRLFEGADGDKFVNVPLKCHDQCGLPVGVLRKDIGSLANIIKDMTITGRGKIYV